MSRTAITRPIGRTCSRSMSKQNIKMSSKPDKKKNKMANFNHLFIYLFIFLSFVWSISLNELLVRIISLTILLAYRGVGTEEVMTSGVRIQGRGGRIRQKISIYVKFLRKLRNESML